MYKVIYADGTTGTLDTVKAERALLLRKQGMLNVQQLEWFKGVRELVELRQAPDHVLVMKTKDMQCDCNLCVA